MSETSQQRRARYRRRQFEEQAKKGTAPAVIHQAALLKSAIEEAVYRAQAASSDAEALRFLKVAAQLEAALRPYLFSMKLLRDSVIRRNASREEADAEAKQHFDAFRAQFIGPDDEAEEDDDA